MEIFTMIIKIIRIIAFLGIISWGIVSLGDLKNKERTEDRFAIVCLVLLAVTNRENIK